jgi:hypothetical protein
LFGNPSQFQARLGPDGEWLTSLAPFEGVLNVWLTPADQIAAATPLTQLKGRDCLGRNDTGIGPIESADKRSS